MTKRTKRRPRCIAYGLISYQALETGKRFHELPDSAQLLQVYHDGMDIGIYVGLYEDGITVQIDPNTIIEDVPDDHLKPGGQGSRVFLLRRKPAVVDSLIERTPEDTERFHNDLARIAAKKEDA